MDRWLSVRDRLLDLDGRNPRPYVPPARPAQPKEKTVTTATVRPPRPAHLDVDLIERARLATGMRAREIVNVVDDPRGLIVTTLDGSSCIIVPADRPDAVGQTGVLCYPTPGREAPRGAQVYADPDAPVEVKQHNSEPWTLADFDVAAAKCMIPEKIGGPGGPSWQPWVDGDPVRAFAVWRHVAATYQGNLRVACRQSREAAECRRIVLESGWLDEPVAAAL